MIILQQLYALLRHSLQMKYLKRRKRTDHPPVKFLAMLVETEPFFSEAPLTTNRIRVQENSFFDR